MNKLLVRSTFALALMACSENAINTKLPDPQANASSMASSSSVSVQSSSSVATTQVQLIPSSIPGAPTQANLAANYVAPVTTVQLASDLIDISAFGSVAKSGLSQNSGSNASQSGTSTTLARRSIAAVTCESQDKDTTYVEGSAIVHETQTATKNGQSWQMCIETNATTADFGSLFKAMLGQMDGVEITMSSESKGDSVLTTMAGQSITKVIFDQLNQPTSYVSQVAMDMLSVRSLPRPFRVYAVIDMDMTVDINKMIAAMQNSYDSSSSSLQVSGTMTMYFKDGTYQCVAQLSGSNADVFQCDLLHDGTKVGAIRQDPGSQDMVVQDANGIVVAPN